MTYSPQHDPIEHIESKINLNANPLRPASMQRADYRPEATTPDNNARIKVPFDRAGMIAVIVVVIVLILVVVWVLQTGGFGTPPVPKPSA